MKADATEESLSIPISVRKAVDERDLMHCRVCGKYLGERRALHHIDFGGDAVGMGGRRHHALANILTVCWLPGDGDCHSLLHSRKRHYLSLAQEAAQRPGVTVLQLARWRGRARKPDRYAPFTLPEFTEAFWARVDVEPGEDACWLWTGPPDDKGYGQVTARVLGLRSPAPAPRVAFFLEHGRWPMPSCLHSCDRPLCVRPSHLREGTQAQNMDDRKARRPRDGVRNPAARLDQGQVDAIRAALAVGGVTLNGLGRQYGVSGATIGRVAAGRTYTGAR